MRTTINVPSNSADCEHSYITALQYADDILQKRIPTSDWVYLQCKKFAADLERSDNDKDYRWKFSRKKADRAIRFFPECLKLTEDIWAGQPFMLSPWQQFCVANIFGWVSREKGDELRFNYFLLMVARKNGKTNIVAGIMLLAMILGNKGLQVYCSATKEAQAKILHNFCKRMISQADSDIRNLFNINKNLIEIKDEWKTFVPLGKDSKTLDGLKPDVAAWDEAAAISDPNVFNVLTSGQMASTNVLNLLLTTAQDTRGPFYELFQEPYQNALVNQDESFDRTFGMIYCLNPSDLPNWDNPELWIKANPNIGVTVRAEKIMEEAIACKSSVLRKNGFMIKNLNCYIGSTQSWLDVLKWDESAMETVPISKDCFMTFDLSRSQDLTAMAMWFRHSDGTRSVIHKCFVPRNTFDNLPTIYKHRYGKGIEEGVLEVLDGDIVNPNIIEERILEWQKQYNPSIIGFDQWSATMLTAKLAQNYQINLQPISQYGKTINPAAMDFERLLNDKKIYHSKSSFISWQIANAQIRPDNKGNLYPQKENASSPNKIDGVMCMIMACSLDAENPIKSSLWWAVA